MALGREMRCWPALGLDTEGASYITSFPLLYNVIGLCILHKVLAVTQFRSRTVVIYPIENVSAEARG